jgi:hypothetical protein
MGGGRRRIFSLPRQHLGRRSRETGCFLLLVVHRDAGHLLAGRIGSGQVQRALLAVRRHDYVAGGSHFAAFLVGHIQRVFVHLFVRPRICSGVAGERIFFTVELARPLGV